MQVSLIAAQVPALSDNASSGAQQKILDLTAIQSGIAQSQQRVGAINNSVDKVVTGVTNDAATGLQLQGKGNSANTPAALARAAVAKDATLADQPFGQVVSQFTKAATGVLGVSDETSGMLVLAKGSEAESMAIKQPMDKVLGKYAKGAAIVEDTGSAPADGGDAAPKPLDPAAMGGGAATQAAPETGAADAAPKPLDPAAMSAGHIEQQVLAEITEAVA